VPWSIAAMPPMCSAARCLRWASFALGDSSRRARIILHSRLSGPEPISGAWR
jgi:hypothetical protein